jgi:serine phosphatase RsbU (regulator of sigma subunit)
MYGASRLIELLRSHSCETPQQQIEALQRSLQEYTHATSFADDVTCIVVAIQGMSSDPQQDESFDYVI